MMAEKPRLSKDHRAVEVTKASVEACATLIPLFGTERGKMPCYPETAP